MNVNVREGESLTPQAAVAEIRRIERLHGALARRASALTWMIWGMVAPAIFVSYNLLAFVVTETHAVALLFPLLWMPWAVLGIVTTATLWRSVGLVIPVRTTRMREGILTGVLIVGLIFAGFATIVVTHAPIVATAWVLLALGLGLTTIGFLGINSNDASERRLWIVGGILLVATALLGSLLLVGSAAAASQVFAVISPLASALVFFGGGLYLTRRD